MAVASCAPLAQIVSGRISTSVPAPGPRGDPAGEHHPGAVAHEERGAVHHQAERGQAGPDGQRVAGPEHCHACDRAAVPDRTGEQRPDQEHRVEEHREPGAPAGPPRQPGPGAGRQPERCGERRDGDDRLRQREIQGHSRQAQG